MLPETSESAVGTTSTPSTPPAALTITTSGLEPGKTRVTTRRLGRMIDCSPAARRDAVCRI